MKTKIILWSLALILIIGLITATLVWRQRPQVLTLKDGTKLTLLGVDYGKEHREPKTRWKGPDMNGGPQSFTTPDDTLVLWILTEHSPDQWPNLQVLVSDLAGTAGVAAYAQGINRMINDQTHIMSFQLNAFPRRDRKFAVQPMAWGMHGQETAKGRFVIANPVRGAFPRWAPEPLPDTQSDGDLAVTLTHLDSGVPGFNGNQSDGVVNKAVRAVFHTEQNGVTVTNWDPVQITTSDATGNHLGINSWSNHREAEDAVMTYQYGLWPNEPAWKFRVEMSRTSGFNADETWTVTNIPVQGGSQQDMWNYNQTGRRNANPPVAETTLNGIHLKILPALQWTDQNQGGQKPGGFRLLADPDPAAEQMRFTLDITDDRGRSVQTMGTSAGGNYYSFQLMDLRRTKTLNVTLALHKSRFVEFTVKPQKASGAGAR